MADKDDDFYDSVTGMAERLGLKGDDRRKYVHEHMTRGGYRMEPTYVPNDDEDEDEGSSFFGSSRKSSSSRSRSDDDDDRGSRRSSGSRSRRSGRNSDWWND
jgi:hypothetical protein